MEVLALWPLNGFHHFVTDNVISYVLSTYSGLVLELNSTRSPEKQNN